jgi:hypothetical protein
MKKVKGGSSLWSRGKQFYREKQLERTIEALKKNKLEAVYVPDAKGAVEELMTRIPDGATGGMGGSITIGQIGLLDALKERKIPFIWPRSRRRPWNSGHD